ncbi:MAG TPA: HAD family hydrolase [Phycisphaerae bacterium]|nr:HAD family hydrolase [Phycisphaerae bacterium]
MTQNVRARDRAGHRPSAVLFDLDGTLTRPYFDFDAIRREIGLPTEPWAPILESLEHMTRLERTRAEAILHRHEHEAAEASELWDDARHVVGAIRAAGIPAALMTRNSRRSVDTVMAKHGLRFDAEYTREDGPIKPAPDPVLILCRRLNAEPTRAWVIGDYLFDLQSGNSAGAVTVLMLGDSPLPDWADQARHVIRRLSELLPLLGLQG